MSKQKEKQYMCMIGEENNTNMRQYPKSVTNCAVSNDIAQHVGAALGNSGANANDKPQPDIDPDHIASEALRAKIKERLSKYEQEDELDSVRQNLVNHMRAKASTNTVDARTKELIRQSKPKHPFQTMRPPSQTMVPYDKTLSAERRMKIVETNNRIVGEYTEAAQDYFKNWSDYN